MSAAIETLIARLREERVRSGRTQAEIAAEMGVKQSWVSDIETGKGDPKLSTLQRYHRAVTGKPLRIRVSYHVPFPTPPHQRTDFAIAS